MKQKILRSLSKRLFTSCSLIVLSVLVLAGCSPAPESTFGNLTQVVSQTVTLPIDEYEQRRSFKGFGEYIDDRFIGYHVADDIEYTDVQGDVPVYAIADGEVVYINWVSGYGGLLIVRHIVDDVAYRALYGHIDPNSVALSVGDQVTMGQQVALLGDESPQETDGERKHLHFGLHQGDEHRVQGYEATTAGVATWINPSEFFADQGLLQGVARTFDPTQERGGEEIRLQFDVPEGWEFEYVPSLQAVNVYETTGAGTARERSQIFIRYFDASSFLTLSTVDVFETTELTVGVGDYEARRYDIEKKTGVADFVDQPAWRNERHIVTDFHDSDEYDRYYVFAANPEIDMAVYEALIGSIMID